MPNSFLHGVEVLEVDSGSRPIKSTASSVIGLIGTAPLADPVAFPLNVPVLIAGSRRQAAQLLTNAGPELGTLPSAVDSIFDQIGAQIVVVRVAASAKPAETLTNLLGNGPTKSSPYEGVHAFLGAESKLGLTPRILLAPGFTHQRPENPKTPGTFGPNPVVAELLSIAERLRAIVLADGPNTKEEEAFAYAGDFGSSRLYIITPIMGYNSR